MTVKFFAEVSGGGADGGGAVAFDQHDIVGPSRSRQQSMVCFEPTASEGPGVVPMVAFAAMGPGSPLGRPNGSPLVPTVLASGSFGISSPFAFAAPGSPLSPLAASGSGARTPQLGPVVNRLGASSGRSHLSPQQPQQQYPQQQPQQQQLQQEPQQMIQQQQQPGGGSGSRKDGTAAADFPKRIVASARVAGATSRMQQQQQQWHERQRGKNQQSQQLSAPPVGASPQHLPARGGGTNAAPTVDAAPPTVSVGGGPSSGGTAHRSKAGRSAGTAVNTGVLRRPHPPFAGPADLDPDLSLAGRIPGSVVVGVTARPLQQPPTLSPDVPPLAGGMANNQQSSNWQGPITRKPEDASIPANQRSWRPTPSPRHVPDMDDVTCPCVPLLPSALSPRQPPLHARRHTTGDGIVCDAEIDCLPRHSPDGALRCPDPIPRASGSGKSVGLASISGAGSRPLRSTVPAMDTSGAWQPRFGAVSPQHPQHLQHTQHQLPRSSWEEHEYRYYRASFPGTAVPPGHHHLSLPLGPGTTETQIGAARRDGGLFICNSYSNDVFGFGNGNKSGVPEDAAAAAAVFGPRTPEGAAGGGARIRSRGAGGSARQSQGGSGSPLHGDGRGRGSSGGGGIIARAESPGIVSSWDLLQLRDLLESRRPPQYRVRLGETAEAVFAAQGVLVAPTASPASHAAERKAPRDASPSRSGQQRMTSAMAARPECGGGPVNSSDVSTGVLAEDSGMTWRPLFNGPLGK